MTCFRTHLSMRSKHLLTAMASKSSVPSSPAHINIDAAPPGCMSLYAAHTCAFSGAYKSHVVRLRSYALVVSYILPWMTNQHDSGVLCFATSSIVKKGSPSSSASMVETSVLSSSSLLVSEPVKTPDAGLASLLDGLDDRVAPLLRCNSLVLRLDGCAAMASATCGVLGNI